MRILHLADLHLGKILHDSHLTDDQAHILEQIVGIVRDCRVNVVAVSGDIYDRSMPPVQATVVMDEFLSRLLIDLGVTVILTPGNHDSAERLAFASRLVRDRGLHIAQGLPGRIRPVSLADDHGPVTFFPLPYIEPLLVRKTLDDQEITDFDSALAAVVGSLPTVAGRTVCLAHCFTRGGIGSDSERPLSIGGSGLVESSRFSRFNLTLLGHLHRPQNIGETVFYAGSPLKYSFSESDQMKCATIYDLAPDGSFSRETIPLQPLRDLRMVRGELTDLLAAAEHDPARHDYLWIELTDRGALFDYAAKIRQAYPHVLNITRSEYRREGGDGDRIEIRSKSDQEIVGSFFRHVTGEGLIPAETQVMEAALDELTTLQEGAA